MKRVEQANRQALAELSGTDPPKKEKGKTSTQHQPVRLSVYIPAVKALAALSRDPRLCFRTPPLHRSSTCQRLCWGARECRLIGDRVHACHAHMPHLTYGDSSPAGQLPKGLLDLRGSRFPLSYRATITVIPRPRARTPKGVRDLRGSRFPSPCDVLGFRRFLARGPAS